ncbi:MAG: hypothetical protein ACLTAX_04335 [Waltera sp.]
MVEDLRVDGITTRIKLFSGALVLNYATVDRLIMDMEANHIQRAVVQQINPPNKNCVEVMDNIVKNNDRLYTFGSIHPFDDNILAKIDNYMKMDIKGWKLNPHIWGCRLIVMSLSLCLKNWQRQNYLL